jgi:CRP-like cAMP-binding protein
LLEQDPPRGLGERLVALGRFLRLAPLPIAELTRLARLARERTLRPGERLAVQGQPVRVVHFLISGSVAMTNQGREILTLEAPETVGLLPLAAATTFPYEAHALTPGHSIEVPAALVAEVLEDDFDFFLRVLRQGAETVLRRERAIAAAVPEPVPRAAVSAGEPLGAAERLLVVRNTDLFRRCPVDGLATLVKQLDEVLVPAGAPVLAAGADHLAVVVSDGSAHGVVEALAGVPPEADLRATSATLVLRGTASDLFDTLEDHHDMARWLLAELLARLVQS